MTHAIGHLIIMRGVISDPVTPRRDAFGERALHFRNRAGRKARTKASSVIIQDDFLFGNHFCSRTGTRVRANRRLNPTPMRATAPMD